MRNSAFVAAIVFLSGSTASSQQGRFVGVVTRDSGGAGIGNVEVALHALNRTTRTNDRGEFQLENIPLGRQEILLRHPGFQQLIDTIDVSATATSTRTFVLRTTARALDTVPVVSTGSRYHSARLRGFEERRKEGLGRFLDETELRKHDEAQVSSVLARILGVRLIPYQSAVYATSSRSAFGMNRVHADPMDLHSPSDCWLTVYLDGVRIYNTGMKNMAAPDFSKWRVSDFAGVEVYLGGSTIPPQFNSSDNGCGLLLLWTRER